MIKPMDNEKLARAAVWVSASAVMWCLAAAIASTSLTLIADVVNASLDLAACVLAYVTLRLQRGTYRALLDYGVGKLEAIASLFIGLLAGGGAAFVLYEAFRALVNPQPVSGGGIVWGLIGCWVISGLCGRLWWQFKRQLSHGDSSITAAQMHIHLISCWTSLGVSVPLACSLVFNAGWVRYLDVMISVALGLFAAHVGWGMVRHSLGNMVDQSLDEPLQVIINRHLVEHFETYGMFEKVRSRTCGTDIFIEIFLNFQPHTSIGDIQVVFDAIKGGIESDIHKSHVTMIAAAVK